MGLRITICRKVQCNMHCRNYCKASRRKGVHLYSCWPGKEARRGLNVRRKTPNTVRLERLDEEPGLGGTVWILGTISYTARCVLSGRISVESWRQSKQGIGWEFSKMKMLQKITRVNIIICRLVQVMKVVPFGAGFFLISVCQDRLRVSPWWPLGLDLGSLLTKAQRLSFSLTVNPLVLASWQLGLGR